MMIRTRLFLAYRATFLLIAVSVSASPSMGQESIGQENVDPQGFVARFCVECHGPKNQEGDRRFDVLSVGSDDAFSTAEQREQWHEILDRMNLGDMPPEDYEHQPSDRQRLGMIEALTKRLSERFDSSSEHHRVAYRRLNRREYDLSIRSLLGLDSMQHDPTAAFSPDETEDGFNTVGESLVVSDYLMTNYLQAADAYLAAAIDQAQSKTPSRSWRFESPFFNDTGRDRDGLNVDGKYQHIHRNAADSGGYFWVDQLPKGVPASGRYRIRIRATGINRDYPYDEDLIGVPREDPQLMSVVVADASQSKNPQTNHATDRLLQTFAMSDDDPQWYELVAWIDKGYLLKLGYPNGPLRVKYMRHQLVRRHRESFPKFLTEHVPVFSNMHPDYDKVEGPKLAKKFLDEQEALKQAGKPYAVFGIGNLINDDPAWTTFFREYQGPRIRVFEIELDGPLVEENASPPAAVVDLIDPDLDNERAIQAIKRFASRAAGRPVEPTQLNPLLDLYHEQRQSQSANEALRIVYKAVLCSPSFLYHRTKAGPLDDFELARRLAYFLTNAPPDDRLLRLAASKSLGDDEVLREETLRLLGHKNHERFIEAFSDGWLKLSKLGTMLPDFTEHPRYFNERLETAMRDETVMFLREAISKNRPVRWLVDGDKTFLNAPLARLYDIDGVEGLEMRQVTLTNGHRGGLLGQASILTASANGIDTSPIIRGVWVLECLLGTPPSPPPPDVEPLEPDIRGAKTIREQLVKHREIVSCRHCHQRIDPLGFALESFDEIGRFREFYGKANRKNSDERVPIDPSGELPTGESFRDVAELKELLIKQVPLIERNLAEKLLVQATGRIDDEADTADVLSMCRNSPVDGMGLRDMILKIVLSDAFQR